MPEIRTSVLKWLLYDAIKVSCAVCVPAYLVISEGKDGPMLRIWMVGFSRKVTKGDAAGSSDLACSGSRPATPLESRMWEDVAEVVKPEDCCSNECRLARRPVLCLAFEIYCIVQCTV